jgi:hypothetical protein
MKKLVVIVAFAMMSLATLLYYSVLNLKLKTYVVDCTQAKKITQISDNFLSGIGDPSQEEAEIIAQRHITKAVCLNELKGDSSFNPKPYFLSASDLSSKYQVIGHTHAGLRSPGSLLVKFDNGTQLNFCFSKMLINCNRAKKCDCPYDFNWEPRPK